jgi:REP-associated tyrosine transposase
MPRVARSLIDNEIYHVLNRGNAKQTVFDNDTDYAEFIKLLSLAKAEHPISILGYSLMPNHFHLVVRPSRAESLSWFMRWLLTSHVRRHHQRKGTSGHVWQGRYKSFRIKDDGHLLMVMRYVERNPVRAALVEHAVDWPWSSHREALGASGASLLDSPPFELPKAWAQYVDSPLNDMQLEWIRSSINWQNPVDS